MSINAARHVLLKAAVSADGRTMLVAPGVEVPSHSVEVIADLPDHPEVYVPVISFDTAIERERFMEEFDLWLSAAA